MDDTARLADWVSLLNGDALQTLRSLPDESVHCCVTSPPYWALRDYGTGTWEGGRAECDHLAPSRQGKSGARNGRKCTAGKPYRDTCARCGARRVDRQMGLEDTPQAYVERMVEVFREVRRVLRVDGTCWVNIGDTYNANDGPGFNGNAKRPASARNTKRPRPAGLKPKDLCGVPWRLALALQADGWYLRQDIIWHKPNPIPESVRDRCTKAHEYVFLLTKSRRYYWDRTAMQEPAAYAGKMRGGSKRRYEQNAAGMDRKVYNTRNKRSVWSVQPSTCNGVHFATYPPELIRPCILAGCPRGGVVLDPFAGTGTTGVVAAEEGRRVILIELSSKHVSTARERLLHVTLPLAAIPVGGAS